MTKFLPFSKVVAAPFSHRKFWVDLLQSRRNTQRYLLMSLPRSGSTWFSEILKDELNSNLYSEPLNYFYLTLNGDEPSVHNPVKVPFTYRFAGRMAFANVPAFDGNVLKHFGAKNTSVLVKEINPWAMEFIISSFDPKIVFLIRNPIEVAASFFTAGFGLSFNGKSLQRRNLIKYYRQVSDIPSDYQFKEFCEENAAMQGLTLRKAFEIIHRKNIFLVSYDEAFLNTDKVIEKLYKHLNVKKRYRSDNFQKSSEERKQKWRTVFTPMQVSGFWNIFLKTCGPDVENYCKECGWLP